ncbi:unnamed protein product [Trifolium pratense]|uniref:Uncharacterized protein n=1 Tax=Trifolium pratense TaxID=57577 RepID=A0ACB0L0D8_TRIPR|nr:unnamed protein product [Trifolium pratense]
MNDHENEKSILTKLKQQCGGQFTSNMEGMVTDLALAKENQTSGIFNQYLNELRTTRCCIQSHQHLQFMLMWKR